jgi:hypothetical protein
VSTTTTTSIGCSRSHRQRSGTTASIVTASARNASQISQFSTAAIGSHGSPTGDSSITITGITSSAAAISGSSKRSAIRWLRSSIQPGSMAGMRALAVPG